MKRVFYFAMMLMATVFVSCSKDDIGETATKSVAGQWYVTADYVADEETVYKDVYDIGPFIILTYNTSDNVSNEMWVSDQQNFWDFKVKTPVNQKTLTFGSEEEVENQSPDYPIGVILKNGKILPNAGHQKNGAVADSITFDVTFSDDPNGAVVYRLQGVRYSGLKEND